MQLILTLNVWGLSYLGLTGSISWLLMPWLLVSPGHQQPWYWLCRIVGPCLSWGWISITCAISMWRNGIKYKYVLFPLKNLARKGLYWKHQEFQMPSHDHSQLVFVVLPWQSRENAHITSSDHTIMGTLCPSMNWVIIGLGTNDAVWYTGLILGLHPANGRRRYFVTTSLIGWVQA